jgi:hypothetical protein
MILSATIENLLDAQFELNFADNTWNLPPALTMWGGVLSSARGSFQLKSCGSLWMMDGRNKLNASLVLHSAPTSEFDMLRKSGTGQIVFPAVPKFKDCEVQWAVTKRTITGASRAAAPSGPLSRVRLKAKEIAEKLLPPPGKLTDGSPSAGASGTGCGEFPGRVMRRIPVAAPPSKDAFSIDVPGSGKLFLTSPTTHWEKMAKAIDDKYKPMKKTWVDFDGSNRPKTGDIYLLDKFEDRSKFQHVGMIISAEGTEWMTADGGQGNGWQSGFIRRKFHPSGQIDGEFGKKAWLKGWVDLDNLRAALGKYFPITV